RASTPSAWPTTCAAPTPAASPARRRSSSTASATRAPTTSPRSGRPSGRRAPGPPPTRSPRRSEPVLVWPAASGQGVLERAAVAEALGQLARLLDRAAPQKREAMAGEARRRAGDGERGDDPAARVEHRRRDDGQPGLELVDERRVAAAAHGLEVRLERRPVDHRAIGHPLKPRRDLRHAVGEEDLAGGAP